MSKDGNCKDCYFQERSTKQQSIEKIFCKRYPPKVIFTEYGARNYFPEMDPYDWCGEYQSDFDRRFDIDRNMLISTVQP